MSDTNGRVTSMRYSYRVSQSRASFTKNPILCALALLSRPSGPAGRRASSFPLPTGCVTRSWLASLSVQRPGLQAIGILRLRRSVINVERRRMAVPVL